MSPEHIAVMVVGYRQVGKKVFINTISDPPTNPVVNVNQSVGHVYIASDARMHLFGIRLVWAWDEIIRDVMSAFCLLIDSTNPRSIYEGQAILEYLTLLDPVPYIIVANKQDREDAMTVGQIRREMELSDETTILPCVATERASVANVLNTLLFMIRPDVQERIR